MTAREAFPHEGTKEKIIDPAVFRLTKTRLRPGTSGECEAQLWNFMGPSGILKDDPVPEMHWVAESLDAAPIYLRKRHDDFIITQARFLGMIPLLSGSPLD
jgi:hypothetical protein